MAGASEPYTPRTVPLSFGVDAIRPINIPAEDRNRTSPFPYGGARFEFRAVGSSQNVSLVNTCLAALTAEGFKMISDRVETGEKALDVARDLLKKHFRIVFNGNGYGALWRRDARRSWLTCSVHIRQGVARQGGRVRSLPYRLGC